MIKDEIFELIKKYDKIAILRHQRPDGDAMGSTLGLKAILRATYPEKDVRTLSADKAEYTAFLGQDDTADLDFWKGALCIMIDCGNFARLSMPDYAEQTGCGGAQTGGAAEIAHKGETAKLENKSEAYKLFAKTVKIDHHPNVDPYADINWVEDERSSACEMVTDFYNTFRSELKLTQEAALCLYTGMVTDSMRFKIKDTKGETLRMAALLLDTGIDTEPMFAHLGIDTPEKMAYKAWALRHIKYTPNGVAYFYVSQFRKKRLGLSMEEISAGVSFMDSIQGSLIWLGFFEYPDGSIRTRLRSRFTTVGEIAEHYHGGGHAQASGATLYSKKEMKALLAEADAALGQYKKENEGWL